jgi:hypothetical protein
MAAAFSRASRKAVAPAFRRAAGFRRCPGSWSRRQAEAAQQLLAIDELEPRIRRGRAESVLCDVMVKASTRRAETIKPGFWRKIAAKEGFSDEAIFREIFASNALRL